VVADQKIADGGGDVVVLCAEEDVRDVIAYWTAPIASRVFVADDGYQANTILKDTACRLLVTDRILPPWPGLDNLLKIRERNPSLRVAFVDAGRVDDRILARLTGATDFLTRPLTRQALIELLRATELS
jgi:DNA-binding response OmpR family regulator